MKLGSLFSGAGLGDLGWMMAGFDIRWQVEIDDYCQKILDLRFPDAKKYKDIKKFNGKEAEPVDIVAGGFPCQPFSVAGKQRGDQDDRNLWPEMLRIIKEVRPTWVVGENVSGIIPLYLDTVLNDLEAEGYATRTFVFPAHALGTSHRRERIWIVGYARCERQKEYEKQTAGVEQSGENMANTRQQHEPRDTKRMEADAPERSASDIHIESGSKRQYLAHAKTVYAQRQHERSWEDQPWRESWREAESRVCRVTDGCAKRVDRLKALGNGQVVACTAFIGQQIMEFERIRKDAE